MPKALIVYFSQGQTTARIAEKIAEGLRGAGYQVDLHNIRDGKPPFANGYDLLGIGLPVYAFRPPFNFMDYVNGLPDLGGLAVFVFALFGSVMYDALNNLRDVLRRKGAKEAGYFSCRGADYYYGYLKEGYLFSPDHPTQEELNQAEGFGRGVAGKVAKEEFVRHPNDPRPPIVYRLERLLTCRLLVRLMYSRMFLLKRKKCNSCGICIKTCPVGNIKADKFGRPVWGRNCIFCLYCDLKCPQEAVLSPIKLLPLFRLFHIYNIRQALKNPAIDYARVVAKSGQVERIAANK